MTSLEDTSCGYVWICYSTTIPQAHVYKTYRASHVHTCIYLYYITPSKRALLHHRIIKASTAYTLQPSCYAPQCTCMCTYHTSVPSAQKVFVCTCLCTMLCISLRKPIYSRAIKILLLIWLSASTRFYFKFKGQSFTLYLLPLLTQKTLTIPNFPNTLGL